MKKIANVSILTWALSICCLVGIAWFTIRQTSDRCVEERQTCYETAKKVLNDEFLLVMDERIVYKGIHTQTAKIDDQKIVIDRDVRLYERDLARLIAKESMLSHPSAAIEKWMQDGRILLQRFPLEEKDQTERNLKSFVKEWELFMENDMQALLDA